VIWLPEPSASHRHHGHHQRQLANNDTPSPSQKKTPAASDGGNALVAGALQNKKTLDDGTASVSDAQATGR
jgi:hypothetical protein